MNLAEDIQPVTYLKSHAANLLQQVNDTHRPLIITQNGVARGVLQDPESFESTKNALAMLKLMVQGETDIRAGRVADQNEVFSRIQARIDIHREKK
jgi:prevent-host-death family protein